MHSWPFLCILISTVMGPFMYMGLSYVHNKSPILWGMQFFLSIAAMGKADQ